MAIRSLQLSSYIPDPTHMSQDAITTPVLNERPLSEEDYDLTRTATIEGARSPCVNPQAELRAKFVLTPIGGGPPNDTNPAQETPLPTSRESSPPPLPTPPRLEDQADHVHSARSGHASLLNHRNPSYDRTSPEALHRLWSRARALGEYHTEHGRYPNGIFAPGILHTFGMIKALIDMAEPPTALSQFMSTIQQLQRLDVRLGTALATTLDDICPYLLKNKGLLRSTMLEPPIATVDSQNDAKELTIDS
jgi:hypothetical protein